MVRAAAGSPGCLPGRPGNDPISLSRTAKTAILKLMKALRLPAVFLFVVTALAPVAAQTGTAQRLKVLVPQSTAAIPFLMLAARDPIPGVDIQAELFLNHAQALTLLLRGDADLLYSGTSQGWENRLAGGPIVMVSSGVWGVSSLVAKDPSIKGFKDLKGKRIAIPFPGAPLDFQTRAILAREGLDPDKDVTISYGPFTQTIPRLLAGQLDAAPVGEPMATAMVREKGLVRVVEYAEAWAHAMGGDGKSPQVSLFAAEATAKNRKGLLSDLVNEWRKAGEEAAASPATAAGLYAQTLSSTPAVMEEAIRRTLFAVPAPAENKARVLAYYGEVRGYLSDSGKSLDDAFFFVP